MENQAHLSLREDFDNNIKERFGTGVSPDDFPGISLEDTPLLLMYENDTT